MMSVRIEFDYPQETGEKRTFSLSITGMGISQVGELAKLPEMVEKQYREYFSLLYGVPIPPERSLSGTQRRSPCNA